MRTGSLHGEYSPQPTCDTAFARDRLFSDLSRTQKIGVKLLGVQRLTRSSLDGFWRGTFEKQTCLSLRLLNVLKSEDRGLKVRFSLATIAFDRESAQMSQILSSQGKNAISNPYPHYLARLATSRFLRLIKLLYLRGENCLQNAHFYKQKGPCFERPLDWSGSVCPFPKICLV